MLGRGGLNGAEAVRVRFGVNLVGLNGGRSGARCGPVNFQPGGSEERRSPAARAAPTRSVDGLPGGSGPVPGEPVLRCSAAGSEPLRGGKLFLSDFSDALIRCARACARCGGVR